MVKGYLPLRPRMCPKSKWKKSLENMNQLTKIHLLLKIIDSLVKKTQKQTNYPQSQKKGWKEVQSLRDCKGQVICVAVEVTVREIQAIGAGPCGVNPITEINVLSTPLALQIPMHLADLGSSATCSGKTSLISPTASNRALASTLDSLGGLCSRPHFHSFVWFLD